MTPEDLESYREHGYVLLRGVVEQDALALSQQILERWVDRTARKWQADGLLDDLCEDLDFNHRLLAIWDRAGTPRYQRSPRAELVSSEMHRLLAHPCLLDVAEDLLGTPEIYVHGIFNARPKCPHQKWTDTPWHQDAQYKGISPHHHVPTFWFPLQRVTPENSCLGVQPDHHRGKLFAPYEDETGFLGISPEERKSLVGRPMIMDPGDLLCFTSLTPHHAEKNRSQAVRWSMDFRYQSAETIDGVGKELGFLARSHADPAGVETFEQWWAKGWAEREW